MILETGKDYTCLAYEALRSSVATLFLLFIIRGLTDFNESVSSLCFYSGR